MKLFRDFWAWIHVLHLTKSRYPKLLLSVKEACKLTGVSEKTMRSLAYEQKMMVRIGKRTLIHKKKLEKWIDHQVRH